MTRLIGVRLALTVCVLSLVAAVASPAAVARPALGLCSMTTSRGSVPGDFAIDACIDSSFIWLRNNLQVPIDIATSGSAATPVSVYRDHGIVSKLTRAKYPSPLLLLPGDEIKIPFGSGGATASLADTRPGGFYALATTAADFLPAGKIVQAFSAVTDMLTELNDDNAQYANCIAHANIVHRAVCKALWVRNVTFAVARGALKGVARGLVALFTNAATFLKWAAAQVPDISQLLGSDRTINISPVGPLHLITFDEYPVGTEITNQYASDGVLFSGNPGAFIASDTDNPTSPVLSPDATAFVGTLDMEFVSPSDVTVATTVPSVSFDVGYLDSIGGVTISTYGLTGNLLNTMTTDQIGIENVTLTGPIHSVEMDSTNDPNGAGIDNLSF